jgi:hypothetical protein
MHNSTDTIYSYKIDKEKRREYQKAYYRKNKKEMRNKNLVRSHIKDTPKLKDNIEKYIDILLNHNPRRKPPKTSITIHKEQMVLFFD